MQVEQLLQHKIQDFIDLQAQYANEVDAYEKRYWELQYCITANISRMFTFRQLHQKFLFNYRIQEMENEKNKQVSLLKEKDSDVTILKTQIQSLVCKYLVLGKIRACSPMCPHQDILDWLK